MWKPHVCHRFDVINWDLKSRLGKQGKQGNARLRVSQKVMDSNPQGPGRVGDVNEKSFWFVGRQLSPGPGWKWFGDWRPRAAFVWSFHFGTRLESVSQNSNKKMCEEYVQEAPDNPSTMKTLWSYHSAGFSLFQSQWESNISQDGSPENWGIDNG